jgi:FkbM family methyltransferase
MLKQMSGKLSRKMRLQKYVNSSKVIKVHDQIIEVPVILGLSCDLTETWMIDLLRHLLKQKKGTFFDVGVNLGQTLIKLKGVDPTRKYLGFEPNPTCVFYVQQLIKKNKFEDCMIMPFGLFIEDKILFLECINDNEVDSAASLIKDFRPDHTVYHRIPVPVFRFQSMGNILGSDKVGVVKIDVEGAELEVVKSLREVFEAHRPITLLEVLPVYSSENLMRQERQEELEGIFNELNYSFFRVIKDDHKFIGLKEIEKIGVHSDLNQCDFVVLPNELVAIVQDLV